jgi:hypothetical protein
LGFYQELVFYSVAEHVEAFAKRKVAHDIECEEIEPH